MIVAWDPATAGADLDANALLCGGGWVLNPAAMVFYNQPTGADGAARAAGRDRPSAASATDTITLDLGRMPADIMKVVVAVSLDGSGAPPSPPWAGCGSRSPPTQRQSRPSPRPA